ncbi:hypothetical protein KP79_PYT11292 [Mizuhopecten yessoensis]|uniref:Uncharacterized protein n=1 Tax=Mizuhopecten yessoensis TaxID=6573 RepID=A0A210R7R4_MIZYE|nr:hypothetical protein KP79_PYT11292 [Mizuhopecten yessoensis]
MATLASAMSRVYYVVTRNTTSRNLPSSKVEDCRLITGIIHKQKLPSATPDYRVVLSTITKHLKLMNVDEKRHLAITEGKQRAVERGFPISRVCAES